MSPDDKLQLLFKEECFAELFHNSLYSKSCLQKGRPNIWSKPTLQISRRNNLYEITVMRCVIVENAMKTDEDDAMHIALPISNNMSQKVQQNQCSATVFPQVAENFVRNLSLAIHASLSLHGRGSPSPLHWIWFHFIEFGRTIDASAKDGRPFCLLFSLKIFERNSGNSFLSYVFYIATDVEFVAKEIIPRILFEKP